MTTLEEMEDASLLEMLVPDPADTLGGRHGEEEAPHSGLIVHLLSNLKPGSSLARVAIPSFFLEPRSLLERQADLMMHPELLLDAVKEKDPRQRMVKVTKWFLSGWHYKTIGVKKPYNPIVGETFAAMWKHDDGSTSQLLVEQVLHRPPISALYFENRQHKIVCNAHVLTKSKFQAPQTAKSIMQGAACLHFLEHGEEYVLTMPTYYANGLLLGGMRMELGGECTVLCEATKARADLNFKLKPTFAGKSKMNRVDGVISFRGEQAYTFDGHWNGQIALTEYPSKKTNKAWLDVTKEPVAPKLCLPEDKQGEWESRRLWTEVTKALNKRPRVDWGDVDSKKEVIEEAQRKLACHRESDPVPWTYKLFRPVPWKNPATGEDETKYEFKFANYDATSDRAVNLIALSRNCPDPRDGGDLEGLCKKLTRPIPTGGNPAATGGGGGGSE
jgi:hypothetical protein